MKNKPNFFFDNRGFPNWGEGGGVRGPPLGNFSHIIPFFFLKTFLSVVIDMFYKWGVVISGQFYQQKSIITAKNGKFGKYFP